MKLFRKLIAISLALLCVGLSGCQTQAAEAVDAEMASAAYSDVSLYSYEKIQQIDEMIAALTEKELASLENLEAYQQYKADYQELEDQKVQEIVDMIAVIDMDNIKIATEQQIRDAESAFEYANDGVKSRVSNYSHLETARQRLEQLKEECWVECETCGGDGKVVCRLCNGRGSRMVKHRTPNGKVWDVSQDCHTTQSCSACSGRGGIYVEEEETIPE